MNITSSGVSGLVWPFGLSLHNLGVGRWCPERETDTKQQRQQEILIIAVVERRGGEGVDGGLCRSCLCSQQHRPMEA